MVKNSVKKNNPQFYYYFLLGQLKQLYKIKQKFT